MTQPDWLRLLLLDGVCDAGPDAMRLREMSLPPRLQLRGKVRRELRDAYLARILLRANIAMTAPDPWQALVRLLERERRRVHVTNIIADLEARLTTRAASECHDAARELYGMVCNHRRGRD